MSYLDSWSYNQLNKLGFYKKTVNHTNRFGSENKITNHMEITWSQLKKKRKFNSKLN